MYKNIPLSVPNFKGNELKYVSNAISSEWVSTGGPYVSKFEQKITEYVNSNGAVACQSGTAGLHIGLKLCGVTSEHEVIVPTLTFIAAVNPVKYIGAEPIFIDCDDSLCIDIDKTEEFCKTECEFIGEKLINKTSGKHIKAIVIVHVFGNLANMEKVMNLSKKYNLKVVEDATEALGTYYKKGKYKGLYAGVIGDIGIYSFNGNKIITTGGGGMIVSMDEDILKHAKHLTTQAKSDELYYTHDEIGYNYRMTNIQAALGLAQLEQLEEFIDIKIKNYNFYKNGIDKISGINLLPFREDIRANSWFYSVQCDDLFQMNRDEIIKYLSTKNIQTRPIWGLISEQTPYLSNQQYNIEKAKFFLDHVFNIPCSTNLEENDIKYVLETLSYI